MNYLAACKLLKEEKKMSLNSSFSFVNHLFFLVSQKIQKVHLKVHFKSMDNYTWLM